MPRKAQLHVFHLAVVLTAVNAGIAVATPIGRPWSVGLAVSLGFESFIWGLGAEIKLATDLIKPNPGKDIGELK